jgi:hypothetical protein
VRGVRGQLGRARERLPGRRADDLARPNHARRRAASIETLATRLVVPERGREVATEMRASVIPAPPTAGKRARLAR